MTKTQEYLGHSNKRFIERAFLKGDKIGEIKKGKDNTFKEMLKH